MDTRKASPGSVIVSGKFERGQVVVGDERCGYGFYAIDARSEDQRLRNTNTRTLDGDLVVFIPGHGQRAATARRLQSALVETSSSKVLWSIDIDPPEGGDPVKADALIEIIRHKAREDLFGGEEQEMGQQPTIKVTLVGWSHGGAITLRAAESAPDLFPNVAVLCSAGLEEREIPELLISFVGEVILIALNAFRRGPAAIATALRMGNDVVIGLAMDLVRSRSLKRLIDDLRWGAKKVVGSEYMYAGRVAILFGEADKVMRWKGVLPECQHPDELDQHLVNYERHNFPRVHSLNFRVLEGNHLAPELLTPLYVQNIFEALNLSPDA